MSSFEDATEGTASGESGDAVTTPEAGPVETEGPQAEAAPEADLAAADSEPEPDPEPEPVEPDLAGDDEGDEPTQAFVPVAADPAPAAPVPPVPATPAVAAGDGDGGGGANKLLIGAVVLALVIGAVVAFTQFRGDDTEAAATDESAAVEEAPVTEEIVLQSANTLGPDSFTDVPFAEESEDSGQPVDPNAPAEPPTNRVMTGGSVGLYGGTENEKACDKGQLIDFLEANPGKARAWVAAQNADPRLNWSGGKLRVADLPRFIGELTPAVVLRDTLVTNHGFRSAGVPTTFTSVLEAGTKAMVDKYGVFRVRCFCGNPLIGPRPPQAVKPSRSPSRKPSKAPSPTSRTASVRPSESATTSSPARTATVRPTGSASPNAPRYTGDPAWPKFDEAKVVEVRTSPKPLPSLPLTQPDGRVVHVRTGTDGLVTDALDASPSVSPSASAATPSATPSASVSASPTPTAAPSATPPAAASDLACAASFCVPLRPGWRVECADQAAGCDYNSASKIRLIDSKGRLVLYEATDLADADAALDRAKAELEGGTPPCVAAGARDTVTVGQSSVRRDRWVRDSCQFVNTLAFVPPALGKAIYAASANDREVRELLAEMTFL